MRRLGNLLSIGKQWGGRKKVIKTVSLLRKRIWLQLVHGKRNSEATFCKWAHSVQERVRGKENIRKVEGN